MWSMEHASVFDFKGHRVQVRLVYADARWTGSYRLGGDEWPTVVGPAATSAQDALEAASAHARNAIFDLHAWRASESALL